MSLLINILIRFYWLSTKELDNVVIEQLNAVVETLTTIKASSESEKPIEKIEEPATASNGVKNFEPEPEPTTMVPEPVKEPVVEPVKELEPVIETEWVQVTTKKAKKNKKKSKSKSESESKSPTPKVDEPETKTVEAVEVSEPISFVVEPAQQAVEQPAPATVDDTTTALTKTDVVETVSCLSKLKINKINLLLLL